MMMTIEYSMLDGRTECVPEMADWTAGHIHFKSGHFKLKVRPPASWHFDEFDGPYDREKWIARAKEELIQELSQGRIFDHVIGGLYDRAKQHCDDRHADLREREANGERLRKGH
jgi:hypothetical protein